MIEEDKGNIVISIIIYNIIGLFVDFRTIFESFVGLNVDKKVSVSSR